MFWLRRRERKWRRRGRIGEESSWRDFARECLCFGCEDVNGSGEDVGGLVKSRAGGISRASACVLVAKT